MGQSYSWDVFWYRPCPRRLHLLESMVWSSKILGKASEILSCRSIVFDPSRQYCLILNDNFSTLDESVWTHEIQVGDYGCVP